MSSDSKGGDHAFHRLAFSATNPEVTRRVCSHHTWFLSIPQTLASELASNLASSRLVLVLGLGLVAMMPVRQYLPIASRPSPVASMLSAQSMLACPPLSKNSASQPDSPPNS